MLQSRPPFSTAARRHPSLWVESAQSPHCIALEVATVRYIVEEKPAVTCGDAQTPWSGEDRHLLCKQEGVGSSPTVSTDESAAQRGCGAHPKPGPAGSESAFGTSHDSGAMCESDPLPILNPFIGAGLVGVRRLLVGLSKGLPRWSDDGRRRP